METLIYIFIFVIGACFGSFGSVLIWRLRTGITKDVIKSIMVGRSECPKCKNILKGIDLIPIFSWVMTGGKCRYCKSKVSKFYPLLEVFTGVIFMFSYRYSVHLYPDSYIVSFMFWAMVNWLLFLLFVADILFYELNILLWILLTMFIVISQFGGWIGDWQTAFVGGAVFALSFYLIYIFGKRYMKVRFGQTDTEGFGEGDVMVALDIGLLLPFLLRSINIDATNIAYILFYYIMLSCVIGVILAVIGKITGRSSGQTIPFLPAMILAFWIMLVYGPSIIIIL